MTMKVTKYPQSCLLLEKEGKRIVIDPGNFFAAKYTLKDLGELSAVIYTHRHSDHADVAVFENIKQASIPSYGNADVCAVLGQEIVQVVSGNEFEVAGFTIMPHDIEHFKVDPVMGPPQNTGYIIDGTFFHPGDGHENNGVKVDDFAVPIAGPFDYEHVIEFIRSVGAKRVIPIHFSNQERYPVDPSKFMHVAEGVAEIILLEDGQSTEL
jgi:L-ascorbate metabolism protein UlaG (beta-lactamase superfamily)